MKGEILSSLKVVQFQQWAVVQFDQLGEAKGVAPLWRGNLALFFLSVAFFDKGAKTMTVSKDQSTNNTADDSGTHDYNVSPTESIC